MEVPEQFVPLEGPIWESPPSSRRDRKAALVDHLRELMEAVALVDCDAVRDDELVALTDALQPLGERAKALPRNSRGAAFSSGGDSAMFERSPFCGRQNPLAPALNFAYDGEIVSARVTLGPLFEGPPGHVHGGFVAALYDEVLGAAQQASGRAGMTASLNIRLKRPTPLGVELLIEAGLQRIDGRKIHVTGRCTSNGMLLSEAEALFISPRTWPPEPLEAVRSH